MTKKNGKVRYAVIGQGHLAQTAILPAFRHAKKNSELAALVSHDPAKLKRLGSRYRVQALVDTDHYDELLASGTIDAVYITLPNHLHRDYAVRAARAGIHVLCEKPMDVTLAACEAMIRAAQKNDVKLMIAYRLHFEPAHLHAVELAKSGKIGEPKVFNSTFTLPVNPNNYRAGPRELGGGPLYDIGIYCINTARALFQADPVEVSASSLGWLRGSEETMAVTLRFSEERVANFVCSFGTYRVNRYQLVGTEGVLSVDNAYEYRGDKFMEVRTSRIHQIKRFKNRDQFATEIAYFSDCILQNRQPGPSGHEGLTDIRIIRGIFDSASTGRSIRLSPPLKIAA